MIRILNWIAHFFSAIGAINWGFFIFFKLDLIDYFCGLIGRQTLSKYFYAFIALCGIYALVSLFKF